MIDGVWGLLALLGGGLAGVVFFGGLWWTVQRGVDPTRSVLLWFVSLLARTAFALGTFFVLADHRWERMLLCMAGFTVARLVIVHRVKGQLKDHLSKPAGADACA